MSRAPQPKRQKPAIRTAEPPPAAITLAFRGTDALLRIDPPRAVAAVLYDGAPLAAADWAAEAGGALRIACPAIAFDAMPHSLRLLWQDEAAPAAGELTFRSEYRGDIHLADDHAIVGWLYDTLRPASALTLEVICGGRILHAVTTLPREHLKRVAPEVVGGGFHVALPRRLADAQPEMLTMTVRGSGYAPFGPILRGATLPAMVAAGAAAAQALGRSPAGLLFGALMLPAFMQAASGPTAAPRGALRLRGAAAGPRPAAPTIDVVIPVYRGQRETLDCLESLIGGAGRIAHRLIVIDDCSPEPELSAALSALGQAGKCLYLRSPRNEGFVAAANRGMALSTTADVVLLNADTVAPAGFLDRLYRAAYGDAAIATVTPLSNNATIYSLPGLPGAADDPWQMTTAEIDQLCQTVNAGAICDMPTAHGFCMFVKRAALDDVGMFDTARFGTGYGEENDFSLRALQRGWRNVCAADVYVSHRGAISFAETRSEQLAGNLRALETLYPWYSALVAGFIRTDPLHRIRNAVQKAVWRRHARAAVFITLALEGGAVRHAEDMMARLAAEGWLVLALSSGRDADGERTLLLRRAGGTESLHYPLGTSPAEALADILDLAPRFIHVQHVIDLPDGIAAFIRECGIPYIVTLHDFFYACPKVTLLDAGGRYCGMPPASRCTRCVRHGPIHPQIHPDLTQYAEDGGIWRGTWHGLLHEAVQVIAPSQDTADRYAHLFPGLEVSIRPHPAPAQSITVADRATASASRLRVALPGAIGPQKGSRQLLELVRHCSLWHDDIVFVVVGYTDRPEDLAPYSNIILHGSYAADGAVAALAQAGCHVALLLSVFPETFSYTLSESLAAGLVPVAYDFGAIGERIRALGAGVTIPLLAPPEQIVAAIRQAALLPAPPEGAALYGVYPRLLGDYYTPALTDLAASITPPDLPRLLLRPVGIHADGWCDGTLILHLWAGTALTRLAVSLWVPEEGRLQAVEIACDGRRLLRSALEPGGIRRIVCALPESGARLLEITCRFDFVVRLAAPDVRSCGAMLSALQVSEGRGWTAIDLPGYQPAVMADQAG